MNTPVLPQAQQTLLRADERGHSDLKWLDSRHSFSFGEYYNPERVAFRSLRVINDDKVAPGMGFPTHPHRDMEILTYVISGQLQHKDSMGNGRVISAGELQAMSAGKGVAHSEFNPSRTEPAHFLQIWLLPAARGLTPSYAEWKPGTSPAGGFTLLGSPDAADGSVRINQDARLYLGDLAAGQTVIHRTEPTRGLWIQVIEGELAFGELVLQVGDGLAVEHTPEVQLTASSAAKFLFFDLA